MIGANCSVQIWQLSIERPPRTVKQATERLDGGTTFLHDPWQREGDAFNPGHGITAVLEGGDLLEKVSIACSMTHST